MIKNQPNISSNEAIRDAIRKIALKNVINKSTGTMRGTERVFGYVTKIHLDESDELYGTIDVEEYSGIVDKKPFVHEGVLLTAIQNNISGYVIIPKMYSEVLVSRDPATGTEYVIMFSHVDTIQLDSHETITVGVSEREPYSTDPEAPDVEDLPETGNKTLQTFKKDSIVTEVLSENQDNKVVQTITPERISQVVGKNKSSITVTQNEINLEHNKGIVKVDDNSTSIIQNNTLVKVTDGVTYIGTDRNTDDAVLGVALAEVLEELLNALIQVKTTTQLGPQPFLNVAQFASMKGKISAYKSAHSGFLTNKVLIQKK